MTPHVDRTVRDVLGDPASWPATPAGFFPPNDVYLLAEFLNAVPDDDVLIVQFKAGGQLYRNDLKVKDADQANLVAARLQARGGDVLLDALEAKLAPSEASDPALR